MLRIPGPGERLPPLVVPLKGAKEFTRDAVEQVVIPEMAMKRRRKKRRPGKELDTQWDQEGLRSHGSGRREKRQMFWMMVSGATLFALLVAGVMVAMFGGDQPEPLQPIAPVAEAPAVAEPTPEKSDIVLLTEAEPVVRAFLDAGTVDDILPLVRNPEVAEAKMRRYYQEGKIDAPGLTEFNSGGGISRVGNHASVRVRTRDYEMRQVVVFDTPDGIKIDWESWVGWSEMPWEEFLAKRPTSGTVFRLNLSTVSYFNFAFADDEKWQSYHLVSPDGEHSLYGYVEKGSVLDSQLAPSPDVKAVALTLSLKFPENADSKNQVIIEKLIADGWVVETDATP